MAIESTNQIHADFVKEFWNWYDEHHTKRYREQGKDLRPDFNFHKKQMNFKGYQWTWVALFIQECYNKKSPKSEEAKHD